jgi:oxygen tolerance protein BatD
MKSSLLLIVLSTSGIAVIAQSVARDHPRSNKIFVRASISKSSCFIGEPLVLTYKLYSSIRATSKIALPSKLRGFSYVTIDDVGSVNPVREQSEGRIYEVYLLKRMLLTPVFSGRLTVDPMAIEHVVSPQLPQLADSANGATVSDLVMKLAGNENAGVATTRLITYSNAVDVVVKELPAPKSIGDATTSSGGTTAIGDFSITAYLATQKVFANRPFTIKVSIKGKGNLATTDAPSITWPAGVQLISADQTQDKPAVDLPARSSRDFKFLVTTNDTGTLLIPAVTFLFFDPATGDYRSAQSKPLSVYVNYDHIPGAARVIATGAAAKVSNNRLTTTRALDKSQFKTGMQPYTNYRVAAFVLSLLGGAIIMIVFITTRKRQLVIAGSVSEGNHATTVISLPAQEEANPLNEIQAMFDSKNFSLFYHALYNIIWQSIADKLNVRPTDQNKEYILSLLRVSGWNEEDLATLNTILDRCAWNLYVPDPENTSSYHDIYAKARQLMARLNQ